MLDDIDKIGSALTRVQTEHLKKMAAGFPLAADTARAELKLYVPLKSGEFASVMNVRPGTVILPLELENVFPVQLEECLAKETFRQGKGLTEWQDTETGKAGIKTYVVQDFGGKNIAVAMLAFRLSLTLTEYEHILRGAQLLLSHGEKTDATACGRLTPEDGILIADRFHRIIYADEIILHIYRNLGVGSLIGRNLRDPQLRRGIDREIISRKRPGDREMQAGERVLRERRLHFAEGGSALGDIVILSDITEQRQHEQEAKIQEALMQRIQELEDELEHLKDSLETRKLLDRAKGIIMSAHHLTEGESYRRIQRYAMMKRMTLKEVAEAIIKAAKK